MTDPGNRRFPVATAKIVTAAVSVAALLLIGRGAALLYSSQVWYDALGAGSVWRSELVNTTLLYGWALIIGTAFAYANIAAVRRSIVMLVVPKRIGNIEIGEEISASRLSVITLGMSVCVAATSCFSLPHWTTLALWRSDVKFGDIDPYFGADLGHYVAWLPVEHAMHDWAIVLVSTVALLVVLLYALTPSLRWSGGRLRVTAYVRRHILVLGAVVLVLIAWDFRLDAYQLLIHGNGPDGLFTYTDHRLVLSADLLLSILTVGAAAALLFSGWFGHTVTSFVCITLVLLGVVINSFILPWVARSSAQGDGAAEREAPYRETREAYSARAFPEEAPPVAAQYAVDSATIERIAVNARVVVYPHAEGVVVLSDTVSQIAAPHVWGTLAGIAHAWTYRSPALLNRKSYEQVAVVSQRDVRDRVRALAPIFTQSRVIGLREVGRVPVWLVDLYATSTSYPLSVVHRLGQIPLTYRRHIGVAYVHGLTGEVRIVLDEAGDPISRAWFQVHEGEYVEGIAGDATGMTEDLPFHDLSVYLPDPELEAADSLSDALFRTRVHEMYRMMQDALKAGDLRQFGDAFDSLGRVLR